MEYIKADKLLDHLTSSNEPIKWVYVLNDLMDNTNDNLLNTVSALTFVQLKRLSDSINMALIVSRERELSTLVSMIDELSLSTDEVLKIFNNDLPKIANLSHQKIAEAASIEKEINQPPAAKEKPSMTKIKDITVTDNAEQLPLSYVKKVERYKGIVKNGVLANPEVKPSSKRYFQSKFPYASGDSKMRNRYISYLVQKKPSADPFTDIADEVLKYFKIFHPQRVYGVRSEIKTGISKPEPVNPLSKEIKKAYKKGASELNYFSSVPTKKIDINDKHSKKGINSFSDIKSLGVDEKPFADSSMGKRIESDYIDEEVLAELDGQLKYL